MEVPQLPLGQITKLARQYYPSLPPAARAFIDVEDLVQYGAIRWFESLHKYDRRRGGMSTFTHHVVRSWFLEIIRTFKRARYPQQILLPVEEIRSECMAAACHLNETGAKQRLDLLISLASPEVRRFLGTYYFGGGADFRGWSKGLQKVKDELQWLISRTGVTAEDFRACQLASLRCC